jgi:hypothetical protein
MTERGKNKKPLMKRLRKKKYVLDSSLRSE